MLAAASIAILLALRRWGPRSLPGPLLVVALGMLVAAETGLADRGVDLVGSIPPGLPEFVVPDLTVVSGLLPAAAGVALMAFVESMAAPRAFTAKGEPTLTPIASFALLDSQTSPAAASRRFRPGACHKRRSNVVPELVLNWLRWSPHLSSC